MLDFKEIAAASRKENSRPEDEQGKEKEIITPDEELDDLAPDEESESAKESESEVKEDAKPAVKTDDSQLAETEILKKRLHDNQAAYHKEHQELLNARKELELLKAGKSEKPPGEAEWFAPDVEDLDDKAKEQPTDKIVNLEKKVEDLERQDWQNKWDAAAQPVRAKYADYNLIVEEVLGAEFETNTELQKRFQEKGATPEAAYELGKELYFLRNPDKYREHIRAEEEAKTKTTDEEPDKKDISRVLSANSKPPGGVSTGRTVIRAQSLIDRVLSS